MDWEGPDVEMKGNATRQAKAQQPLTCYESPILKPPKKLPMDTDMGGIELHLEVGLERGAKAKTVDQTTDLRVLIAYLQQ